VPLIQPITTLQPALESLIAVLAGQQQPTPTQHAGIVSSGGTLTRLNGSGAATGQPPASTPVATAAATGSAVPVAVASTTSTP
jgi:hypothetical protein